MLKKIGLITLASLALGACGSSSSTPTATHTISLTRAAYVSGGSPGFKAVMSMTESLPSLGQVVMNGHGTVSTAAHTGAFNMQMSIPAAAAAQAGLSNFGLQMILEHGTLYMKLPSQLASKIPGGRPWWKLDLSQAGKLAGIPGLSSLMNGTQSVNDPGQYLSFLRATADGSVKAVGSDTINGIQTTHYRARVDLSKLPNAVPASSRAGVEQLIGALQKRGAMPRGGFPIDAWIDSSNLIRQIELSYSQPLGAGGQSAAVSMKADYTDYGPQPPPALPPAGQTIDLLTLFGR